MITDDKEEINSLVRGEYEAGNSMATLANELDLSAMAIFNRLRRMGVETRKRTDYVSRIGDRNRERVLSTWRKNNKLTGTEIARLTGLSCDTARRYLREEAGRIAEKR